MIVVKDREMIPHYSFGPNVITRFLKSGRGNWKGESEREEEEKDLAQYCWLWKMEPWAKESRWLLEWKLSHLWEKPWCLGIRGGHQISGFPLITASKTWPMNDLFLHSTLLLWSQAWSWTYSMRRALLPLSIIQEYCHPPELQGKPARTEGRIQPHLTWAVASGSTQEDISTRMRKLRPHFIFPCSRELWLGKQPMRSEAPKFPPKTLLVFLVKPYSQTLLAAEVSSSL